MAPRVRLGRSELMVSPICYGSWQANPKFWGPQPKNELLAAMRRAFDVGVNFYDTADAYADGFAEELMGEALAELPRDQIVVATKVCHHFYSDGHRHPDLSGKYIEAACDASLTRLGMDYIDLYLCHAFVPNAHPGETTEAMEKLKKVGKIRAFGVSNYSEPQLRMALRFGDYTAIQPQYSLLDVEIEDDLLPTCAAEDIGVLVYSPLARGLLTGKYTGEETFSDLRRPDPRFSGEVFRTLCAKIRSLEEIADGHNLSITQLVLAATLMHPAIHCAIVGVKRPQQIEDAAGAMGQTLSLEEYWQIRSALA